LRELQLPGQLRLNFNHVRTAADLKVCCPRPLICRGSTMIDDDERRRREERLKDLKNRAHGDWTAILRALGVNDRILSGKNQPCPMPGCGGTDRFQYTDKFGEGNYHCRSCGTGGGLKLAQAVLGTSFPDLLDRIESQLGCLPQKTSAQAGPAPEKMKRLCQRIWQEAKPIAMGDEVDRYLRNRGIVLDCYPKSLRFHPALGYYEKQEGEQRSKKVTEYPAMIACVQGSDGHAVTLHRTYLKNGQKALGSQSKKVLSSGINGAAVRLDECTDELAVTEGLETGLAVRLSVGKPTWVALNCGNLEKLWIPDSVKRLCIYGDNDANSEFAGQVSAYTLAQRWVKEGRKKGLDRVVKVYVPKYDGTDWADVWLANHANQSKAA
jgi:putative DNA primase/helicase